MMLDGLKICILAPHTDDGELGVGGTIHKYKDRVSSVHYYAFSLCEESLPEVFPKNTLKYECQNATTILGINKKNVSFFDFKVRLFSNSRQQILDQMIKIRQEYNPDIIFTTSSHDIHQDHKVIHEESVRAFKNKTLLGYDMPWNCLSTDFDLLIGLNEENITAKLNALGKYKSQSGRKYISDKAIKSIAFFNGIKANTEYAEVFEVIRWIVR